MSCKKNICSAELFARLYNKEVLNRVNPAEREVLWSKLLIFCGDKSFHSKPKYKMYTVFFLFDDNSLLGVTYEDKETRDIVRVDAWESANDYKRRKF